MQVLNFVGRLIREGEQRISWLLCHVPPLLTFDGIYHLATMSIPRIIFTFILHAQSCSTLCDPMDYGLPGSSVYRIFQAKILK